MPCLDTGTYITRNVLNYHRALACVMLAQLERLLVFASRRKQWSRPVPPPPSALDTVVLAERGSHPVRFMNGRVAMTTDCLPLMPRCNWESCNLENLTWTNLKGMFAVTNVTENLLSWVVRAGFSLFLQVKQV